MNDEQTALHALLARAHGEPSTGWQKVKFHYTEQSELIHDKLNTHTHIHTHAHAHTHTHCTCYVHCCNISHSVPSSYVVCSKSLPSHMHPHIKHVQSPTMHIQIHPPQCPHYVREHMCALKHLMETSAYMYITGWPIRSRATKDFYRMPNKAHNCWLTNVQ